MAASEHHPQVVDLSLPYCPLGDSRVMTISRRVASTPSSGRCRVWGGKWKGGASTSKHRTPWDGPMPRPAPMGSLEYAWPGLEQSVSTGSGVQSVSRAGLGLSSITLAPSSPCTRLRVERSRRPMSPSRRSTTLCTSANRARAVRESPEEALALGPAVLDRAPPPPTLAPAPVPAPALAAPASALLSSVAQAPAAALTPPRPGATGVTGGEVVDPVCAPWCRPDPPAPAPPPDSAEGTEGTNSSRSHPPALLLLLRRRCMPCPGTAACPGTGRSRVSCLGLGSLSTVSSREEGAPPTAATLVALPTALGSRRDCREPQESLSIVTTMPLA